MTRTGTDAVGNPSPKAQDGWEQLDDSDEIWKPPQAVDALPTVTGPLELDFLKLGWENFEKLICRLVSKLEHTQNVRIYGRPGQRQDGIDVACLPVDGSPSVYQAKRWQKFKAGDLREAVRQYADGRHPIRADRFIIVVASDTPDTAMTQALQECQDSYPNLKIEFWDCSTLSRILVDYPDLVQQFFGRATRQAFCVDQVGTSTLATETLSGLVQRGPIRHLGLSAVLNQAESDRAAHPADAAESYAQIIQALDDASFERYAHDFRLLRADALEDAGDLVVACRLRLDVAWSLVDAAELWTGRMAVRFVARSEGQLPSSMVRSLRAIEWIIGRRLDAGTELADVAVAVDSLGAEDPQRHIGLLALVEDAIAARDIDYIAQRVDAIYDVIDARSLDTAAPLIAARLRCCIADATGEWRESTELAWSHYPPEVVALISARWGRFAALRGDVDLARERYRDAIRAAIDTKNYGDASAWLYALRSGCLDAEYGVLSDIGDIHLTAEAVRSFGDKSILPHGRARTRATTTLNAERPIDAFEAIVRYLRHSTVKASLSEELEAHAMFGQLFSQTDRLEAAISHYVMAGDAKAVAGLAGHWPDQAIELHSNVTTMPNWEREAAFAAATAFEDWMEGNNRKMWSSNALAAVTSNPGLTGKPIGPLTNAVYGGLAATASSMTVADADRFVSHTEQLCELRRQLHFHPERHTVSTLYEIANLHPNLSERAVVTVVKLLLRSQYRGVMDWLSGGDDALRRHHEIVEEQLTAEAQAGDRAACIMLAVAGCAGEAAIAEARRCLEKAMAPAEGDSSVWHGDARLHEDAYLVGLLGPEDIGRFVAAMMAFATSPEESLLDRQRALFAVRVRFPDLTESARTSLFGVTMECARGLHDGNRNNSMMQGTMDPLSRFRIGRGPASLQTPGLACAAVCAATAEQQREVRDLALELLGSADASTADAAARAAASLPPTALADVVEALRVRPDDRARWLAAVTWAKLDNANERTGRRFAADASSMVREGLAACLRDTPIHRELRSQLLGDVRRRVRDAAQRSSS